MRFWNYYKIRIKSLHFYTTVATPGQTAPGARVCARARAQKAAAAGSRAERRGRHAAAAGPHALAPAAPRASTPSAPAARRGARCISRPALCVPSRACAVLPLEAKSAATSHVGGAPACPSEGGVVGLSWNAASSPHPTSSAPSIYSRATPPARLMASAFRRVAGAAGRSDDGVRVRPRRRVTSARAAARRIRLLFCPRRDVLQAYEPLTAEGTLFGVSVVGAGWPAWLHVLGL